MGRMDDDLPHLDELELYWQHRGGGSTTGGSKDRSFLPTSIDVGTRARQAVLRSVLPRLTEPDDHAVKDVVASMWALLRLIDLGVGPANRGGMQHLRDVALRERLISQRGHRLRLTLLGRTAMADHRRLRTFAARGWFSRSAFGAHVGEVTAATLLCGAETAVDLRELATVAVAHGFRGRDGTEVSADATRSALGEWLCPGYVMGWVDYSPGPGDGVYRLTEPGYAAAVDGLRYRLGVNPPRRFRRRRSRPAAAPVPES